MKNTAFHILVIIGTMMLPTTHFCFATDYHIIDLSQFGGWSTQPTSVAYGINNEHEVVGWQSFGPGYSHQACRWYNGVLNPIYDFGPVWNEARAICNYSSIVGSSNTGESHAFHYVSYAYNQMVDLGTLGGNWSEAYDISDYWTVVGQSETSDMEVHAFSGSRWGYLSDLGTLGGSWSVAYAINNSDRIVGSSEDFFGYAHAFFKGIGVMEDIGTLGGDFSEAYGINDSIVVVGTSTTAAGETHAFRWENYTMEDIGTLGGECQARAINNANQIVGGSQVSPGGIQHAFLWESNVMTDLNTLLPPNSGWILNEAQAINNLGQIVGCGTLLGTTRAFLLSPVDLLGTLEGTVFDELSGNPVNNADVTIFGQAKTQTDELGRFSIPNLLSGTAIIKVGKCGYNGSGSIYKTIVKNSVTNVDISLKPTSSPVVSDVVAIQRTDASKFVDIFYKLAHADSWRSCTVNLEISNDNGNTWTVSTTYATGNIGSNIHLGSDRQIVWDPTIDASGQIGCNFKARVSANDGWCGVDQAESSTFCLDDEPPPIPGESSVKVGQLVITGNSITKVSGGIWNISGNVMVNGTVRLTGTVRANTATLMVSGNGQIWIDNVPEFGNIMLYEGVWQFDGQTAATTTINTFLSQLELAGLKVRCTYIGIVDTTVKVQGYVELPAELGGGKINIDGDHFVELSMDEGLVYDLTIENEIDVKVGGFRFTAEDSTIYLSNAHGSDKCIIYGVYKLSDFLGGVTVNLDPNEGNYFSVSKVGETVQVDIVGSISIGHVIIVPPDVVYAKNLFLDMNTVTNSYYATGTVGFPMGSTHVDANGELGILGGYFDCASLVAEFDPAIAILYTPTPPPVPIVYLYRIGGGVYNLSPVSNKAVVIMITGGFQGGPEFFGYNLVELDLTGTLDLSGSVRGDAELRLGNLGPDEAILTGNATVIIDLHNGMYLAVEISKDYEGKEFLSLGGKAAIDLNNNFTGSLRGTVVVPSNAPVIGAILGGQGAAAQAYVQAIDDADYTNDYLAAGFKIIIEMPWPLEPIRMEPVIEINLTNNQINWLGSWDRIKEVTFPGVETVGDVFVLAQTEPADFIVLPGLDYVIFRASWDTNTTDLHIITPLSEIITPNNVNNFSNVVYYTNHDVNEAFYIVKNPMAGTWKLFLSEEIGIGDYTFQQLQESAKPTIAIAQPSTDTNEPIVTITWTDLDSDDDASISLYYDTDREGADGTLIVAGLSENDSNNSYIWNTIGVPTGDYYIYATISDGKNLPFVSYSIGRVHVSDPNALLPPTNLAAAPTSVTGELLLTWLPITDPNLHHYNVYYTSNAAGEGMEEVRGAGNRSTVILKDLLPGETYRLSVASVDDSNNVGSFSEPIIVTLRQDSNHMPLFAGSIPTQAVVRQLYQFQVLAEDMDGDTITYSLVLDEPNIPNPPNGLTISAGGLIEWIPEPNQLGNHTFAIKLDDSNSPPNQRLFKIYIDDPNTGNGPPEILSEAPPLAKAGTIYNYQVVATDPNSNDSLYYSLLIEPNNANIDAKGLIEWSVPSVSGRYELLVKVTDTAGLFVLQRFTVQVDLDAPKLNAVTWGSLIATSPNSIKVEATPVPDATGLVEYLFEVDTMSGLWQRSPKLTVEGLSPNTKHSFRLKARDASAAMNESDWSQPKVIYTLVEVPSAPAFIATDTNSIKVQLDSGNNPPTTALALYNISVNKWINLAGKESSSPVWADAATWGIVRISGLSFDTTYHLCSKARNQEGIETEFSPILVVSTDEPDSAVQMSSDRQWLYENPPDYNNQKINLSAAFINDPYNNSEYTYTWQAPVDHKTGRALRLVAGGGASEPNVTYAAPENQTGYATTYKVVCMVTGKQMGNNVSKTFYITVFARVDFNRDGFVDYNDLSRLVAKWLNDDPNVDVAPAPVGDGIINFLDFAVLAKKWTGPAVKSVDFNADGIINFEDFAMFANHWLQNEASYDIDPPPSGDGIVDTKDLAVLTQHWLEGSE